MTPEAAEQKTEFPTIMRVETEGDLTGIRIEFDPQPDEQFVIVGGEEALGTLKLCREDEDGCLAPDVEEGRRTIPSMTFLHPETEEFLFGESVAFVKDTVPPEVTDVSAEFDGNDLSITLTATDATTTPAGVVLWYSTDDGRTYHQQTLPAEEPVLGDDPDTNKRTFRGTVSVGDAKAVTFFAEVQDLVFNYTFYGVETATR